MVGLLSCTALEKKQQEGAVAELNGHYLYRATIDAMTMGLSTEDSLRVAQQYISQWAKDILVYDQALSRQSGETKKTIETLVDDYRRTLYVEAYERQLVEQRMPKTVADSVIMQVYNRMPERFVLSESVVQGLLVTIPNDAPKSNDLRKWMKGVGEGTEEKTGELMDKIEKYAYQNATGYEFFTDKWITTTNLLAQLPMERKEYEAALRTTNFIECSDTLKTYLVRITGKHLQGEPMPLDYARPEIEKMILYARRRDFLLKEREKLYNEAIQDKKLTFYNE